MYIYVFTHMCFVCACDDVCVNPKVTEVQYRADDAHSRSDTLKEELEDERHERVRIEEEHMEKMENLRKDLALLVNALGGRAQLDVEDFTSISPPRRCVGYEKIHFAVVQVCRV